MLVRSRRRPFPDGVGAILQVDASRFRRPVYVRERTDPDSFSFFCFFLFLKVFGISVENRWSFQVCPIGSPPSQLTAQSFPPFFSTLPRPADSASAPC